MVFKANLILDVEKVLINMEDSIISFDNLLKETKEINKTTLKEILVYLDKINKILITNEGIIWIENSNESLENSIKQGLEL